eukprot:984767-Amphidinium_carterae.1
METATRIGCGLACATESCLKRHPIGTAFLEPTTLQTSSSRKHEAPNSLEQLKIATLVTLL